MRTYYTDSLLRECKSYTINIKWSVCVCKVAHLLTWLINHHARMVYEGVKVQFHIFITLTLDDCFMLQLLYCQYHLGASPRAGQHMVVKIKNSNPDES
jgi:hypothetical protein